MMNLVTTVSSIGGHFGAWRHPSAWSDTIENLDHYREAARTAEKGLFDALFLADGNGVRDMEDRALFEAMAPTSRPATFEPITLLTALAMTTKHIGLIATATTTYDEPFLLARRFASLDHLSAGRGGWNVVTTSHEGDSRNFGLEDHIPKEERYERAAEFVEVVTGLWDSWAPDAFVEDRKAGRYLNADRVHVLGHRGKHFTVSGPLNATRPTQGRPILFHAGQSEAGRDLAARYADCVFTVANNKEKARAFRLEMKERARSYGRAPEDIRVLPGMTSYVGETVADSDTLYSELASSISPALGVSFLSKMLKVDLSSYSVDDPLPAIEGDVVGVNAFRKALGDTAQTDRLTIRQTYERALPNMGHALFKGTGVHVADQMEDWYRDGACDGFLVAHPLMPRSLDDFVEMVVPELQRRGLHRTEYKGRTARENMRLPIPKHLFFG